MDALTIERAEFRPGVAFLHLCGRLDTRVAAEQVQREFQALLRTNRRRWVVDLSGLSNIGSAGLAVLISHHALLRDTGGLLVFLAPLPKVFDRFRALGAETVLDFLPTLGAALERMRTLEARPAARATPSQGAEDRRPGTETPDPRPLIPPVPRPAAPAAHAPLRAALIGSDDIELLDDEPAVARGRTDGQAASGTRRTPDDEFVDDDDEWSSAADSGFYRAALALAEPEPRARQRAAESAPPAAPTVGAAPVKAQGQPPGGPPSPGVTVTCPACRHQARVSARLAGKLLRCRCGATVRAPDAG